LFAALTVRHSGDVPQNAISKGGAPRRHVYFHPAPLHPGAGRESGAIPPAPAASSNKNQDKKTRGTLHFFLLRATGMT
jgi:hypothetical protein